MITGETFQYNLLPASDRSSRHAVGGVWSEEGRKRQSRDTVYDESGFRTALHSPVCYTATGTQI